MQKSGQSKAQQPRGKCSKTPPTSPTRKPHHIRLTPTASSNDSGNGNANDDDNNELDNNGHANDDVGGDGDGKCNGIHGKNDVNKCNYGT